MNDSCESKVSTMLFGENTTDGGVVSDWRDCFPEIVGQSSGILQVLETVSKIATSDSAVLIFGESGTGKELIAAAIHRLSLRSGRQFIPINCSAIPENLLESELFGHEKGSFTGAVARRPGYFEVADGGTIFLDEIGDMPQRLQAKLLRVLQEKQFTSVGGHQIKTANVRIVAATNIDLTEAVRLGRFRLDLFYRLNVLPVSLPPLRDRREDVKALLQFFLAKSNRLSGERDHCFLSREVLEILTDYDWPGNVRELQNLVERLVVMVRRGEVRREHLPSEFLRPMGNESPLPRSAVTRKSERQQIFYPESHSDLPLQGINLPKYIEALENDLIVQALERTGHNKNRAAKLLGLNRTTLVERIKKRRIAPLNTPAKAE